MGRSCGDRSADDPTASGGEGTTWGFQLPFRTAFDAALDGAVLAAFRQLNGLRDHDAKARLSLLGLAIDVSGCSESQSEDDRAAGKDLDTVIDCETWMNALVRSTGLLALDGRGVWHLPPTQAVARSTDTLQVPCFPAGYASAEMAVATGI